MSELIDRQETVDRFNVIRPVDPKKDEYTKGIDVGIAMCIVAVKDQLTIQPEKTQLSQEGTTSALNNQVNLCDSCTYTYPECPSEKDDVIFGNGIGNDNICACNKYQPTIQPEERTKERTETHACDLISRQAAIDALDCINGTEEVLRSLPPAQHERKRGKWLADNRPGGGFWVCSCCKFPSEAFAANVLYKFCPNCGAKMTISTK